MRDLRYVVTILVASLSSLLGCSGKLIPTGPSVSFRSDSTYIGSWNWIKSIGGYAGRTMTPESEGYTIRIELTADSIYKVHRSDVPMISKRFSIHREEVPGSSDSADFISFSGEAVFPPERIRLMGRDTLNLTDQYMDGYDNFYSKERL